MTKMLYNIDNKSKGILMFNDVEWKYEGNKYPVIEIKRNFGSIKAKVQLCHRGDFSDKGDPVYCCIVFLDNKRIAVMKDSDLNNLVGKGICCANWHCDIKFWGSNSYA